jgi:hypothetical protein
MSRAETELHAGPPELPLDVGEFYSAGDGIGSLNDVPGGEAPKVLETMGPAPFPRRGGLPVLGFLTTLYEHVSQQAAATITRDPAPTD